MSDNVIVVGNSVFVFPGKINECAALKLCDPVPEFDTIEKCRLCGKML